MTTQSSTCCQAGDSVVALICAVTCWVVRRLCAAQSARSWAEARARRISSAEVASSRKSTDQVLSTAVSRSMAETPQCPLTWPASLNAPQGARCFLTAWMIIQDRKEAKS